MSHKHCIFCGIEIPVPRPTTFNMECVSSSNTLQGDTFGKRYHAVIVGSAKHEIATKPAETPAAVPELPTDVELLTKRCLWQWCHIADLEATVKAHAERIHNQRIEIKRLATPAPANTNIK